VSERRRSPVEVLRNLPEVFDISTMCRMTGLERGIARTYLSRWARAGLVAPAGPRAGIHFNLIRAPDAPGKRAVDALRMAYPSAVLVGASVLHAAGWITQIPRRLTVAVATRPSLASLDGFDVSGRTRVWYASVHADLVADKDYATYGLRALSPAMALADLHARPRDWCPDPDDLDLDDGAWNEVRRSFETLGVAEPEWLADMPGAGRTP